MVPFLLYQNILSSDITPTKSDAEAFSTEHKSDENKRISKLHLCMGGNTSKWLFLFEIKLFCHNFGLSPK